MVNQEVVNGCEGIEHTARQLNVPTMRNANSDSLAKGIRSDHTLKYAVKLALEVIQVNTIQIKGCLAQLVEHISRKDVVVSSSLTVASKKKLKRFGN